MFEFLYVNSKAATKFSSCSLNYLRETLNEGYAQCLFDEPKKVRANVLNWMDFQISDPAIFCSFCNQICRY